MGWPRCLLTLKFYDQEITQEKVPLAGSFLRFLSGTLLHTAGNYRRLQWPRALCGLMAAGCILGAIIFLLSRRSESWWRQGLSLQLGGGKQLRGTQPQAGGPLLSTLGDGRPASSGMWITPGKAWETGAEETIRTSSPGVTASYAHRGPLGPTGNING